MAQNLEIKLLTDIAASLRELKKFQSTAAKSMKTVEKETKKLNKTITKSKFNIIALNSAFELVGKAVNVATRAYGFLSNNITSVVEAAKTQENAVNAVNQALVRSGEFSVAASKDVQAFAASLQETTRFGDETVLQMFALSKAFGANTEQAKLNTQAALELSVAAGISLEEATRRVGRAMSGSVDDVSKFAPAIKNLTKEQLRAGEAAKLLIKELGGTAAAELNTFEGAATQLSNTFGDVQEAIGEVIIQNPAMIAVTKLLTTALQGLEKLIDENKQELIAFVQDGIIVVIDSLPALIGAFAVLDKTITKTINVLRLAKNGLTIIAKTVGDFIGIDNDLGESIESTNQAIIDSEKAHADREEFLISLSNKTRDLVQKTKDRIAASNQETAALEENLRRQSEANRKAREQEVEDARKAAAEIKKIQEQAQKSAASPLAGVGAALGRSLGAPGADTRQAAEAGAAAAPALGGINSALKGFQGAVDLAKGLVTSVASAFLGPVGQVVGEIFGVLAQGPEVVRQMITEFLNAIPVIIQNVILAIPAVIDAIIDSIPVVIQGILDSIPILIQGLLESIPELIQSVIEAIPMIIESIITFIVEQLPVILQNIIEMLPVIIENLLLAIPSIITKVITGLPRIFTSLISQIPRLVTQFISQIPKIASEVISGVIAELPKLFQELTTQLPKIIGEAIGGVLTGSGSDSGIPIIGGFLDALPFSHGGTVPPGFPNDSFPARLTSGETVVDRDTNQALRRFLAGQSNGGGGERQPVVIQIGERQLAEIMLDLSQQGFRTG